MYLFSQPTLFPRDINVRSVTRKLNKAIKERERERKKKPTTLDTLLPIRNRERGANLLLFHQSRYSFFLLDATGRITLRTAFLSILFSSTLLSTSRRKNVGIFPLYFLSFPPSPLSFFSFLFTLFIEPSQRLISRIP